MTFQTQVNAMRVKVFHYEFYDGINDKIVRPNRMATLDYINRTKICSPIGEGKNVEANEVDEEGRLKIIPRVLSSF